ncbi:HAD family hydrolase [Chloroflexota bacterium]
MNHQEPTLILFDIDGTLLAPAGSGRVAVELALAELFDYTGPTNGVAFAGATDWHILAQILLPLGYTPAQVTEYLPKFAEAVGRHLAANIHHHAVRPLPGALDLVQSLTDDPCVHLGLLTGNGWPSVPVKLEAAGFEPSHFPVGAFGHEALDRSDLPPLALQRAQTLWDIDFPPARIVIVGDTPNDVICTRSVQGRAVAVLTGPYDRAALTVEKPYAILDDLTDRRAVEAALFGLL